MTAAGELLAARRGALGLLIAPLAQLLKNSFDFATIHTVLPSHKGDEH